MCDAIDVGRRSAHDAEMICANVEPADVVGEDQEDVRFLLICHRSFIHWAYPGIF
jgi:hypothetical protein